MFLLLSLMYIYAQNVMRQKEDVSFSAFQCVKVLRETRNMSFLQDEIAVANHHQAHQKVFRRMLYLLVLHQDQSLLKYVLSQ